MPFRIIRDDITHVKADAIVNTANPRAVVGRGTDQAIYEAAGWDRLLEERKKIGEIPPGECAVTEAFGLNARFIIHTVGPVWQGGHEDEEKLLDSCYRKSLLIARQLGCESVAFPIIAAGRYHYPKDRALRVALDAVRTFLDTLPEDEEMEVLLVVYDREIYEISRELADHVEAYIDDHYEPDYLAEASYHAAPVYSEAALLDDSAEYSEEAIFNDSSAYDEEAAGDIAHADELAPPSPDHGYFGAPPACGAAPTPDLDDEDEDGRDLEAKDINLSGTFFRHRRKRAAENKAADYVEAEKKAAWRPAPSAFSSPKSLNDLEKQVGETFREMLFRLIDERGLTDPAVYRRANIDRKLFSKIRNNKDYQPKKNTALALAIALELSLDETVDLIGRAGYALSPSSIADLIISYCIETRIYDIFTVNSILFDHDQALLGY